MALCQNRSKPTGLAALRVTTIDQEVRPALEFRRCAMLPLRDAGVDTGQHADLGTVGGPPRTETMVGLVAGVDLDAFPARAEVVSAGGTRRVEGGDVVSSAPEPARPTLNAASAHHDEFAGHRGRLVYGGHAIGIAMPQVTRALPDLVAVAGWHGCDHVGPVEEGGTLHSRLAAGSTEALTGGGSLAHLKVLVRARSGRGSAERDVLDWRPIAVLPTGGGT